MTNDNPERVTGARQQWLPEAFFNLDDFVHSGAFHRGQPVWEALRNLDQYLRTILRPGIHPGAKIMDGAVLVGDDLQIEDGCVIEAGAYVRGPAILGRGCEVRHGAYIRGGVLAGEGCLFGHASEFKNAILLNGAKAPHFNYVGDSILGAKVNMGAGSKLSNVKVVHGTVSIRSGDQRIETGMRKLGAILGDHVEIGCNAVLNPGTLLGPRSIVYPCASVVGAYGAGTLLRLRQELAVKTVLTGER